MYRVIFKGKMEDMYLDNTDGLKLKEWLQSDDKDEFVELQGTLVELRAIKAIIPNSSNPDDASPLKKGSDMIAESYEALRKEKMRLLSLPANERAKNIEDADMLSVAVRGKQLTDEEKDEVRKCKEEFFTANPDYAFANPICYKHVLKDTRAAGSKDIQKVADLLPTHALRLMEYQVRNGIKRPFDF